MAAARRGDDTEGSAVPLALRPMRLDPNTHAFVYATAFITSLTFAIFAMNVIALVLQRVLG